MVLKIKILDRDALRLLLRKGKTRDTFQEIAFKNLTNSKELILGLENDIPTNFISTTKLKNNLQSSELEFSSLTQIICVLLSAHKEDKPSDRIDYSIEDIQRFFTHLDKEQLKKVNSIFDYRTQYNSLLNTLIDEEHPFGKIWLDENWNIRGENCKEITAKSFSSEDNNVIKNNLTVNNSVHERHTITSVLNIKSKGSFFKRYQTILAYLFGTFIIPLTIVYTVDYYLFPDSTILVMILVTLVQITSWVCIIIGFYYTHKYAKGNNVILWRTIIFIIGVLINILLIVYGVSVVLDEYDYTITDDQDDLISSPYPEFNPDPMGDKFGFLTIQDTSRIKDIDSLTIPKLELGDKFHFTLYLYFHNQGRYPIKNVNAKIFLNKTKSSQLIITGRLSGSNVKSIFDVIELINLPKNYTINFEEGFIRNDHGDVYFERCPGTSYEIPIREEILHSGIKLNDLGVEHGGWCDQGNLEVSFSIENVINLN